MLRSLLMFCTRFCCSGRRGGREEIAETLKETGWLKDSFFRFAQAVSECLSNDSKEKMLLDGFLTGKDRIISEAKAGWMNMKNHKYLQNRF